MLHGSPSPGVAGSELTRLLARLSDAPPPAGTPVLAERLGHWLGWTGAISLSTALNAPAPGAAAPRPLGEAEAAAADCARVHATHASAIEAGPRELRAGAALSAGIDFAPYRRHCLARQQAMHESIGALRRRLRDLLARHSPQGARLAALDAVLDDALAPHERSLLGLVPLRLEAHFDRLKRQAAADPRWPDTFRADLARVLRAELAHRLVPAQGLLDALTTDLAPT